MKSAFIELKTTDGYMIYVRPEQIGAVEEVPSSARVEGHIKVYIHGFKFLIQGDMKELMGKLSGAAN